MQLLLKLRLMTHLLLPDPTPPANAGGFLLLFFTCFIMGLDFYVQLLIKHPTDEEPTIVGLTSLGNAQIRRELSPYMTKDDQGCIPSQGEFPFNPGQTAYNIVKRMRDRHRNRVQELGDELEKQDMSDWSSLYKEYVNLNDYVDLLNNSLWAAESVVDNDNVSCRIVWC